MNDAFAIYTQRLRAFIGRSLKGPGSPSATEREFNELALALFKLQFEFNPAYARYCENRGHLPAAVTRWEQIPALPAVAFKELEVTCLPPETRSRVFHSSGTTEHRPSRHFHNAQTLGMYEASLLPWFLHHFPLHETPAMRGIALTPSPRQAPHSSLVHMLDVVSSCLRDFVFGGKLAENGSWSLETAPTRAALEDAASTHTPALLLGTAFSFVELLDHLEQAAVRIQLPPGSCVMETGGYKGRSRALPRTELYRRITAALGIPPQRIVGEYGMSELSSQAYNRTARTPPASSTASPPTTPFRFPPWARALIVSPEHGGPVEPNAVGLIQVLDLANIASVAAVRTEDLAVLRDPGFELVGRAPQAEPRGCSLMSS